MTTTQMITASRMTTPAAAAPAIHATDSDIQPPASVPAASALVTDVPHVQPSPDHRQNTAVILLQWITYV